VNPELNQVIVIILKIDHRL